MLITQARKHGQHFEGNAISQNTNAQSNTQPSKSKHLTCFKKMAHQLSFSNRLNGQLVRSVREMII